MPVVWKPAMLTAELLARLAGVPSPPGTLPAATGAAFHSASLQTGQIFFALPGATAHGLDHADAAFTAGAAFLVSDRPHPRGLQVADPAATLLALGAHARAQLRGPVIGISGSSGKTTTKDMLAALLAAPASPGNFNTPFALASTLVHAWLTSPKEPLILELGIDHPGEMQQLVNLVQPTHALLTSIGASHLELLGNVENVAAEKRLLLDAVPAGHRFASSQAAAWLAPLPAGLATWGLDDGADHSGTLSSPEAARQTLVYGADEFELRLPGTALATNLLGALAVARHFGVPAATAQRRLASLELDEGRLQFRQTGKRLILDDSYNSNPASVREALAVLARCPAPRSAILGDMRELGSQTVPAHRELGRATRNLECVITAGEFSSEVQRGNPRALAVAGRADVLPLLASLPAGGTLLIKASRSLEFERLVSTIVEQDALEAECR